RDDQERRAGDLGIEELARELVGAAHHVSDDDADLAADTVVAVGHRRYEPFVLADDELLVLVLGEGREDAGLGGSGVREEIIDPRVLQGLDEQHAAGAGDRLAHVSPFLSRGSAPPAQRAGSWARVASSASRATSSAGRAHAAGFGAS